MVSEKGNVHHWQRGVEDFNQGRYWHAHEGWEQGWKTLPAPHKQHLQALIQVCAVLYHLQRGRRGPARSLCESALRKLAAVEAAGGVQQIFPRVEIAGVHDFLEWLQTGLLEGALDETPDSQWHDWVAQAFGRAEKLQAQLIMV